MKIRHLGAAIGLAFAVSSAAPASAQNNKPIRSGNWYEDRGNKSTQDSSLTISFAQSPTDKYLNITKISCEFTMASGFSLVRGYIGIGTASGAQDTGRLQFLDMVSLGAGFSSAGVRQYVFSLSPYVKVGPGRYPSAFFSLGGSGPLNTGLDGNCSIVGDLSDS